LATAGTASAVLAYASGLWAFAGVRIAASSFYAMKDTATPVRIAAIAMAANILLSLALMGPLAHAGLALATALAAMLNLSLLLFALGRRLPSLNIGSVLPSTLRNLAAAGVMALPCLWVASRSVWASGEILAQVGWLATAVAGSGVLYCVLHKVFGGQEWNELYGAIRRRG